MTRDARLAKLEQAIGGGEPLLIHVLRVPATRWSGDPPLTPAECEAFTDRVLGPFRVAP